MPDEDAESIVQQARTASEYGRYNEALPLLHALIERTPTAAAWLERGRVYAALNNRERARADWEAASQADPNGPIGDAARRELLHLLTPPPQPQPSQPAPPATRPHSWVMTFIVVLLVLSIVCSIVTIVGIGRDVLRFVPTVTPTTTSQYIL